MTLGNKLQILRKQKGLSQEQLANRLGVSRQAVSKWELDATLPDTENIIKLKNIFDVSFDYLLDDRTEKQSSAMSSDKLKNEKTYNIILYSVLLFVAAAVFLYSSRFVAVCVQLLGSFIKNGSELSDLNSFSGYAVKMYTLIVIGGYGFSAILVYFAMKIKKGTVQKGENNDTGK